MLEESAVEVLGDVPGTAGLHGAEDVDVDLAALSPVEVDAVAVGQFCLGAESFAVES